jgi:exosortase B
MATGSPVSPVSSSVRTDLRFTLIAWGPIVAGVAFLYAPSFIDLFRGIWSTDEQAHGPIVLSIACWLAWRKWPEMWLASDGQQTSPWGWPIVVFALLLYALGRSQGILLFEIGSIIWLLSGILLLTRGTTALKTQWFALFFMLFMIPLPGVLVDTVTQPMKMAVSCGRACVLFALGYPIARTGVILQIGQYKLLVADACAGLHYAVHARSAGPALSQHRSPRLVCAQPDAGHPDRADLLHRQRHPRHGADADHLPLSGTKRGRASCTASPAWCFSSVRCC